MEIAKLFKKQTKMANTNLIKAKKEKNDEFYTQLPDIEKELGHYKKHFKNKIVFCNCDDPEESNFWNYFALNFEFLGLKKLISTHFDKEKPSYKLEIMKDVNKDGKINKLDTIKTKLKQNGDFRSPECVELLKEADIIVTNPPFSLFREYVAQLVEYKKKFIIIGNKNAINCKEIFPLLKNNNIWLGYTSPKEFLQPDGKITKKVTGLCRWFTNLTHNKRNEDLILYKKYTKKDYPKYDNYNAININKVKDIPIDYEGVMGVPITFLDKFNPEQFEIIGDSRYHDGQDVADDINVIDGKTLYRRILIKNKRYGNKHHPGQFEIIKLIEEKYRVINGKNIYQRLLIKNKRL